MKAGIAVALGLTLLMPTFNALNNSYVQDVAPPSWLPQPDDFQPPDDWTPPEGWEPPEDWEPPEGYEYPFDVPPVCPPPVMQEFGRQHFDLTMSGSGNPTQTFTYPFKAPNLTMGVGGHVNVTEPWQANRIAIELMAENKTWTPAARTPPGGLLQPTRSAPFSEEFRSDNEWGQEPPPWGNYILTVTADFPITVQGHVEFFAVVACGGLAS